MARLKVYRMMGADNIVESVGYAYDAIGRPVGRNGDTFGYNDRGEVTNATIAGRTELHAYDEIGNSTDWAANSLNQYAQFAYDPDGNLLSDGVRNLLLRRLEPRRGARRLRERKDYYACRFHLPALIRWFFRRVRASAKVLKSPP